jgi:hypothetical protein
MPLRGLLLTADGLNDLGRCHFHQEAYGRLRGLLSAFLAHFRLIHQRSRACCELHPWQLQGICGLGVTV